MKKILLSLLLLIWNVATHAQTTITFPSRDSLLITADLYKTDDNAPFILLCHQAGYSRGEYIEIAKKLNKLGYNCLAIDQRSGNEVNGIKNETAQRAKEKNKPIGYLDAEQDIIAGINYINAKFKKKIIVWGSSYSASLALVLIRDKKVNGVIAFSPGEYFGDKLSVRSKLSGNTDKPLFVTSSQTESGEVKKLIHDIKSLNKTQFTPQREGIHGSSALWSSTPNNQEYWVNLKEFLNNIRDEMWK